MFGLSCSRSPQTGRIPCLLYEALRSLSRSHHVSILSRDSILALGRLLLAPTSAAPRCIYNIGNTHPEQLEYVVSLLEKEFARRAVANAARRRRATFADV